MSLQLILGSSGAGKSHYLYDRIIQDSLREPDTNFIIIVPEQFTMQTQRDLVTMHPRHGIMNIDILSFLRLAYRVFEETNTKTRLVLEDTGKSMILQKVIEKKQDELRLFQKNVKRQGFISELKSFISELYQYGVSVEDLHQMIPKVGHKPMLAQKLHDMSIIYQGFQEFIKEKYITAEEILSLLANVISDSTILKNSVICFDGFTGFTPVQNKLVRQLMKLCKKVYVTVTIDEREILTRADKEFKLFYMSQKMIVTLNQLAKEAAVEVEDEYWVMKGQTPYRFHESKPLAALEHNLFRYPFHTYEKEQDDISIRVAKDPTGEVLYTIREIKRLVEHENYRFKDIAVVTGDIANYGTIVKRQFDLAGIPCFIDLKKAIQSNPLAELIDSLLDILVKDFSYETVFRFLRNGLLDYSKEDIDVLENYILAVGIRGYSAYQKEWRRIYRSKGEISLQDLNEQRVRIIEQIDDIRRITKENATIKEQTEVLIQFLKENRMEEKLLQMSSRFEQQEQPLLAKEYTQVYQAVMELLDKMMELLGDEVVTVREYKDLLDSGLSELQVGLIPPGIDQVVVGDIQRTRLKDIKALFFIGVNDGIVPSTSNHGGIISDMERELLSENSVEMAPTKRQNAYIEQFYLYLNLTKPMKRLYLLYSKVDSGGKTLRSSYLINRILKLFPRLSVIDLEMIEDKDILGVLGADEGQGYLVERLRNYTGEEDALFKELYSWYKKQEGKEGLLQLLIDAAFYEASEISISKAVAMALYGKNLNNSVTRLEKYAACAYAHFLSYGLELTTRQEYELAAPDLGSIFHEAMELFSKRLRVSQYNWRTIPEEKRDEMAAECVKEAAETYNNTILLSSKRNEYMIKRVERILKRTIWALCEHVKSGEFEPTGFELHFTGLSHLNSVDIPLQDGSSMQLQGRIDRVDMYETEEAKMVRIVDYKSGNTELDMSKVYYGLQLQLVVYLSAAMEIEEQKHDKIVIPAGIFYYNMNDPMIDKPEVDVNSPSYVEQISEDMLKKLKMNGLVNAREEVIKAMDQSFVMDEEERLKGSTKSIVIPVETDKTGEIGKRSSTISQAQFGRLRNYVMDKVQQFGCEILEGNASVRPYKLGDTTPCEYCEFGGVCGFDQKLPGNTYRKLAKLDKSQVLEYLDKSQAEEDIDKPTKIDNLDNGREYEKLSKEGMFDEQDNMDGGSTESY